MVNLRLKPFVEDCLAGDMLWYSPSPGTDGNFYVRGSATGTLVKYTATSDSSGTSAVRGTQISVLGKYDASGRGWFIKGAACGQNAVSKRGNICISNLYADAVTNDLVVTFMQPLYNQASEVVAVLGFDLALTGATSSFVQAAAKIMPSDVSELTVVQDRGKWRIVYSTLTGGGYASVFR